MKMPGYGLNGLHGEYWTIQRQAANQEHEYISPRDRGKWFFLPISTLRNACHWPLIQGTKAPLITARDEVGEEWFISETDAREALANLRAIMQTLYESGGATPQSEFASVYRLVKIVVSVECEAVE